MGENLQLKLEQRLNQGLQEVVNAEYYDDTETDTEYCETRSPRRIDTETLPDYDLHQRNQYPVLSEQIDRLNEQLDSQAAEIERKEAAIKKKEAEIESHAAEIERKVAEIESQAVEIKDQ